MALLPFAVSLGLGFYIVFDHVFGVTAAFVAGSAFCLLAGTFWYGLGFSLRRKSRSRAMQEERPTPLATKIEQMLTEARVILPGAQALLGFQLTVTLTKAFGQLPDSLKLFHVASLCCVAGAIILLMTPAALSHFFCGRGYAVLLHDRVLVRHPCAGAIGDRHCMGSLCRNLNGGGIVDARRHSCTCRALSSDLPLVYRADGAEGAGRWVKTNPRIVEIALRSRKRNQPTFGGSLCSSSGHRLSTTARVSSEIIPVIVPLRTLLWIRCKSAGIITLPHTIRGS